MKKSQQVVRVPMYFVTLKEHSSEILTSAPFASNNIGEDRHAVFLFTSRSQETRIRNNEFLYEIQNHCDLTGWIASVMMRFPQVTHLIIDPFDKSKDRLLLTIEQSLYSLLYVERPLPPYLASLMDSFSLQQKHSDGTETVRLSFPCYLAGFRNEERRKEGVLSMGGGEFPPLCICVFPAEEIARQTIEEQGLEGYAPILIESREDLKQSIELVERRMGKTAAILIHHPDGSMTLVDQQATNAMLFRLSANLN